MANATDISICCYRNGTVFTNWFASSSNKVVYAGVGYDGMSTNWVTVVKFTIAKPSSELKLGLFTSADIGGQRVLKYKIFNYENSEYNNADNTYDSDGTLTMAAQKYTKITATIDKTLPSGTYYLYLFTSKAASSSASCFSSICNNANGRITVAYEELECCIYIDNGSSFDAYIPYIDNGSSWDMYVLYIDNGSGWDVCG